MSSTCVNISLYRCLVLRLFIQGRITLEIKAFFYPELFFSELKSDFYENRLEQARQPSRTAGSGMGGWGVLVRFSPPELN